MIFTNSYFIFNGRRSNELDILVEKQPDIIRPGKRVKSFTVPGRSGNLYTDENAYENITKTVECAILNIQKLDAISAWLLGIGDVIFSNESDKYYKAVIKNQIPFSKVWGFSKRFIVQFDCQPYKYSANNAQDKKTFTAASVFYGNGSVDAAPIITVYGNGNIVLTVNGEKVTLTGVSSYITVNSQVMDAYKDNASQNNKMTGNFPMLSSGKNEISWTGSVSRVEITPDWRWL